MRSLWQITENPAYIATLPCVTAKIPCSRWRVPPVRGGLTTLGFSGHSYTKPDREYCMTPGRTALYRATIAKLKNEYRGKVDILCGIEWDLLSEGTPKGFDYWIGSAHHLYGKNTGKYYEIDFRPEDLRDCINNDFDGDPLAAVEAYFAEVEKIAAKKPDILGHIDLVKKLNADGSFF